MSKLLEPLLTLLTTLEIEYKLAVKDDAQSLANFNALKEITDEALVRKVYVRVKKIKDKQYKKILEVRNQPLSSKESFENMSFFFDKPVLNEHKQLNSAQAKLKRAFAELYDKVKVYGAEVLQRRERAGGEATGSTDNVPGS